MVLRITEWWRIQSTGARWGFGAGLALILIGAALLTYWVWPRGYAPLFVDLQAHESAALIAQLETLNAEYRVDQNTGVISVPEKNRDVLRTKLVERGIPFKSALGFELFDNAGFGATEFSQKINYQRALEGELARTIMALDPVRYARLHLVLPESSLFKRDREQPKASVTVITAPGRNLTPEQIGGIQGLVSSAVPGLTPELVSVHDHRGVNLSGIAATGGSGAVESRIRAKEAVESYLTAKIYEILSPVYPASAVAVSIDATLRLDHITSSREATTPSDKDGESRSVKQIEQIDELPGAIERLSVGVLLPPGSDSENSVEQVRELIASAIGSDSGRGDKIAVFRVVHPASNAATTPQAGVGLGLDSSLTSISSKNSEKTDAAPLEGRSRLILVGALLGFALLCIALFFASQRRASNMSRAEREALLENVRSWLQQNLGRSEGSSR